eukprot:5321349-Amphidinium_carterae.1
MERPACKLASATLEMCCDARALDCMVHTKSVAQHTSSFWLQLVEILRTDCSCANASTNSDRVSIHHNWDRTCTRLRTSGPLSQSVMA